MRKPVLLTLVALLLLSGAATSRERGSDSDGDDGCNCHGVRSELEISLDGLPESFESSQSYELSIKLVNPKSSTAGFRLIFNGGDISTSETDFTQELDDGWTHTLAGNSRAVWNLTWVSPEDNSSLSTFILHVNSANGNGEYTGDDWDSRSFAVPGVAYEGEVKAPVLSDGEMSVVEWIIAGLALFVLGGVLWYSIRD